MDASYSIDTLVSPPNNFEKFLIGYTMKKKKIGFACSPTSSMRLVGVVVILCPLPFLISGSIPRY